MNIVPVYERFESDGLQLVVNNTTGIAYASTSATAKMLGLEPVQVKRALEKGGRNYAVIDAKIPTPGGSQRGTNLLDSTTIFDLAIEYCPELAKKMGAAGANLYMLNLAGYKSKIVEGNVEDTRHELEALVAPKPEIKQIDQVARMLGKRFGKAYEQRYIQQQVKKHYPALSGDKPESAELTSLPTARALLNPTQIAKELDLFCESKPEEPSPRKVNKLLEQLGYQIKVAGVWSATDKAIAANLVDRKPVETNSRTQKDQLLWSADIISILQEHSVPSPTPAC